MFVCMSVCACQSDWPLITTCACVCPCLSVYLPGCSTAICPLFVCLSAWLCINYLSSVCLSVYLPIQIAGVYYRCSICLSVFQSITSLFAYYLSSLCWCAFLSIYLPVHLQFIIHWYVCPAYLLSVYIPGCVTAIYPSCVCLSVCLSILLVFCLLSIFYLHACLSVYPPHYAANIYHPLVCVNGWLFVCLSNCICSNNLSSISLCV